MTTPPDENADRPRKPEAPEASPAPRAVAPSRRPRLPGVNGRRFVIIALAAILLAWGTVFAILAPGLWSHRKRIEFGRKEVAPAVLGFQKVEPPGVDLRDWDRAVGDTRSLVMDATRSGGLTIEEATALRDDISATADRAAARPETAVRELADLWDRVAEIARRVRPAGSQHLDRSHPRPPLLPAGSSPPA